MRRASFGRRARIAVLVASSAGSALAAPPAARNVERDLAELTADTAHRTTLASPLARARDALRRAHQMDQAGDVRHTTAMREVAAEWLGLARDLLRAVDSEKEAVAGEKRLDDLDTKLSRSRALLEETVARRGRAQAMLDALEAPAAPPATTPAPPAPGTRSAPAKAPKAAPAPPPATAPDGAGAAPSVPPAPPPRAPEPKR